MATSLDLDQLTEDWQHALDAARDALESSDKAFRPDELGDRRRALTEERRRTEELLDDVARVDHVAQLPWLSATRIRRRALGIDPGVQVCIFDLDGVLTDSGRAHAAAWSEVFDALLQQHSEETGRPTPPFDPEQDYHAFLDGKPRLEGIHGFLASRGIHLPDGRPSDSAEARTAYGLSRHKSDALERVLHRRGVTALPGARRYLEAVGHAGLDRAVVSCSQRTNEMLALAGLTPLVEATVDADTIAVESLRSRPAPDVLQTICRKLDVDPVAVVTFTHTPAGVAAGRAADMTVIGVGDEELLAGFGADRVVPTLVSLLDPALR
jgi:beta-phosphoglucomutase-like phosphatase (HAD superfamily)